MKLPSMRVVREIVDPVDRSDPARQALAKAIEEARAAEAAATQASEALARAEDYRRRYRHARDEAETLLQRATAEAAEKMAADFAIGATPSETGLIKSARERLMSAEDNLSGMDGAISKLREAATEADGDLARARRAVDRAMTPVVALAAPALMAAAERAQHRYLEAVAVLHASMSRLDPQSAEHRAAENFVARSNYAVAIHLGSGKSEADASWRTAVETLARDAYALLPIPA
jgi:chromosome segregation ATPase